MLKERRPRGSSDARINEGLSSRLRLLTGFLKEATF